MYKKYRLSVACIFASALCILSARSARPNDCTYDVNGVGTVTDYTCMANPGPPPTQHRSRDDYNDVTFTSTPTDPPPALPPSPTPPSSTPTPDPTMNPEGVRELNQLYFHSRHVDSTTASLLLERPKLANSELQSTGYAIPRGDNVALPATAVIFGGSPQAAGWLPTYQAASDPPSLARAAAIAAYIQHYGQTAQQNDSTSDCADGYMCEDMIFLSQQLELALNGRLPAVVFGKYDPNYLPPEPAAAGTIDPVAAQAHALDTAASNVPPPVVQQFGAALADTQKAAAAYAAASTARTISEHDIVKQAAAQGLRPGQPVSPRADVTKKTMAQIAAEENAREKYAQAHSQLEATLNHTRKFIRLE